MPEDITAVRGQRPLGSPYVIGKVSTRTLAPGRNRNWVGRAPLGSGKPKGLETSYSGGGVVRTLMEY